MAMQSPFFGKRENEPGTLRHGGLHASAPGNGSAANLSQGAAPSSATPSAAVSNLPPPASAPREGGGSKLTVGPNIKLKGVEITDCDTLVVEGTVEATMDSRLMQISQSGAFKGSAEIDIAEIHGSFDGNLTVRQKLVVFATGRVTGKVRYGKLVVEEGGQLAGEVQSGPASVKAAAPAKLGLQAA